MKVANKVTFILLLCVFCFILFTLPSFSPGQTTNERQITFGDGPDQCPCWSPDGKSIAFHSQRSGNADIWLVPASGVPLRQLTRTKVDENFPKWSPNGKGIAFVRFTQGARQGLGNIFVMNADGTNEYQLTDDGTMKSGLAWHPDGKHIVCSEARGTKESFETDVWLINIETKSRQKLLDGYRQVTQKGLMVADLSLNSNGTEMAFSGVPEDHSNDRWLYTVSLKTKKPNAIVTDMYRPWSCTWRPDDKLIAFQSGKMEASEIWVITPDGKNRRKVTSSTKGDRFPCWSPDSKQIVFTRGTQKGAHIWVAIVE